MIFAGIDPGTAHTGFGLIRAGGNRVAWVDSGVVSAPRDMLLEQRLEIVYDALCGLFEKYRPTRVCIEEAFYARNVHTTLVLGHVRGVVLLAARKCGAEISSFSPREIKKAVVGNGNADKEQVSYMVGMLLAPPRTHARADATDALAVALCDFFSYRARGCIDVAAGMKGRQ